MPEDPPKCVIDFEDVNIGGSKIRTIQYRSRDGWVQLTKIGGEGFQWASPVLTPIKSYAPTIDELLEQRRSRGVIIHEQAVKIEEAIKVLQAALTTLGADE